MIRLILIFMLMLSVGCQATTMDKLDNTLEYYNEQLNETNNSIELTKDNNNVLEDKYCEEYIERFD